MYLLINNQLAEIKNGTTVDYTIENPLFSKSEGFSLQITLPLHGSVLNTQIFGFLERTEKQFNYIATEYTAQLCITPANHRRGILKILEVNESEITAQFLDGAAAFNASDRLEQVYINELEILLPDPAEYLYPHGRKEYERADLYGINSGKPWQVFRWVNNTSGNLQNNGGSEIISDSGYHNLTEDENNFSYCVNLLYLTERLLDAAGISHDLHEWNEDEALRYLECMNTLPAAWNISNYCTALPHWTLKELFNELSVLLGGYFDYADNKIVFHSYRNIEQSNIISIKPVDEYRTEYEAENDYAGNNIIKFQKGDLKASTYDCFNPLDKFFRQLARMEGCVDERQVIRIFKAYWEHFDDRETPPVFYVLDSERYYLPYITNVSDSGETYPGSERERFLCSAYLIPLGANSTPVNADIKTTETKISPVAFMHSQNNYVVPFLECGEYENTQHIPTTDEPTTKEQNYIENGNNTGNEFLSTIYVATFRGAFLSDYEVDADHDRTISNFKIFAPCTKVNQPPFGDYRDETGSGWMDYWDGSVAHYERDAAFILNPTQHRQYTTGNLKKIISTQQLTVRFLASELPDVKQSVFLINSQPYLCKQIKTTLVPGTTIETPYQHYIEGVFIPVKY